LPDLPPPPSESEIVVTAARLPPALGDAAFSVRRLGPGEIAAAPRLDEALKQVPGVSLFRRSSSLSANPTVQGLSLRAVAPSGAGRALVTLDGVPQNDPFGGWVIWSSLPPEIVGAAEVVKGAGAGPYGAGALTGVVALEERSAAGEPLEADLSAGERGYGRLAAAADLALGSGLLLASAMAETSDGWTPVRRGAGVADVPLTLEARSAALSWRSDVGRAALAARIGAYEERRGSGLLGGGSEAAGASASLTLAQAPTRGGWGWRLQAWGRETDFAQASVSVASGRASTTPAASQDATPATGFGVNAALRRAAPGWSLEFGADARAAEGETRERFGFMAGDFTRSRVAGGRSTVAGAYVEAARQTGPWLVAGGARLDAWSTSEGVRLERARTTGAVTLDDRTVDRDGVVPTARLGVRRDLGEGLHARAAAYSGFRPPTLNELHRPFRVGNDVTEANAALAPERLHGAELAFGRDGERLGLNATAFWNRLDDPVTNVTVGFGPGSFPRAGFIPAGGVLRERRNAGRIEAVGLELDAAWRPSERLALDVALGVTDARVGGGADAPQLTGKRPAQAPVWTATAGAHWAATERLSLSTRLRWESRRFEDDLNSRVLSVGLQADAQATWRATRSVELYLAADNLFDAAVETGETADGTESFAAPRTVRAGVRFRP